MYTRIHLGVAKWNQARREKKAKEESILLLWRAVKSKNHENVRRGITVCRSRNVALMTLCDNLHLLGHGSMKGSLLDAAIILGDRKIAELLHAEGVRVVDSENIFHALCVSESYSKDDMRLKLFFEFADYDIDALWRKYVLVFHHDPPVHVATIHYRIAFNGAQALLDNAEIDVNQPDSEGMVSLHYIASGLKGPYRKLYYCEYHLAMLRLLISHGANLRMLAPGNRSALELANNDHILAFLTAVSSQQQSSTNSAMNRLKIRDVSLPSEPSEEKETVSSVLSQNEISVMPPTYVPESASMNLAL